MREQTFTHWLIAQHYRDDAVGDLARDVAVDRMTGCMSSRVRTATGVFQHINKKHHGEEVADTIHKAFGSAVREWHEIAHA